MATVVEQPLAQRDYFTDQSILRDPYEYFEAIRATGPVARLDSGIVFVTGFDESVEVLRNVDDFSSVISTAGPVVPLPFTPQGSDISEQIEAHRQEMAPTELIVTYDGAAHSASRAIMNKLFVPARLKANEAFMHRLAAEVVAEQVAKGSCDIINEVATPYVTLVIADLLGVPPEDRQKFREVIDAGPPPGDMNAAAENQQSYSLMFMAKFFHEYLSERRANPREDVMTELANATFPDGSEAPLMEVVKLAMFLFAAGQDTSAKLIGNAMRFLVETPGLQAELRANPGRIAGFLEEVLRLEGSTKATFRLVKRDTRIGDMPVKAGDKVFVGLAAANRDPRRWDDPRDLRIGRDRIAQHVAFGRGAHVCVGAPLARVEVRVLFEELFAQTSDIALDEAVHGPAGASNLAYEPSYIIRGLEDLHIKLTPR
ncbi:MAG: cytochrome P450 [Novosphingobium sp.]|nr:cytochrome P450 [Novosphingobium sp.]